MSPRGIHIGVAGYMGAGKSTFCSFFVGAGFTVIDADAEAKPAMAGDAGVRSALAAAFGPACAPGGTIDSQVLAAAAFASAGNLRRLNEIVRPVLTRHFERRLGQLTDVNTVLDAAMLPLLPMPRRFNRLFWVAAPFDLRLRRIQARRGRDGVAIESRMRVQEQIMPVPLEGWTTVVNNGDRAALNTIAETWIGRLTASHNAKRGRQP